MQQVSQCSPARPLGRALIAISLAVLAAWPASGLESPVLVQDFSPGVAPEPLRGNSFTTIGDLIYFAGDDSQHGDEPWVTDGTPEGTRRLGDVCPGTCSSSPGFFTRLGDRIVFATGTYLHQRVYAIHGEQIEEIGSGFKELTPFQQAGSLLYFKSGGPSSQVMYRTDGTREGTFQSPDFCYPGSCTAPAVVTSWNGALYYVHEGQLQKLTSEGHVEALLTLLAGGDYTPLDATRLVFRGCVSNLLCPLWVTDGTALGTLLLEPSGNPVLTPFSWNLHAWRGRVYFQDLEHHVLSVDGTPEGTRLETGFQGFEPVLRAATENALFYYEGELGNGGALTMHARLADESDVSLLTSTTPYGSPGKLGEKVFFSYTSGNEQRLAATDGTPAGTVDLTTLAAETQGSALGGFFYLGLTQAGPPYRAESLFRTDGSAAGTGEFLQGQQPVSTAVWPRRLGETLLAKVGTDIFDDGTLQRIDPQTFEITPADSRELRIVAANDDIVYAYTPNVASPELVAIRAGSVTDLAPLQPEKSKIAEDGHLFFTDYHPGVKLWESNGNVGGTAVRFDLVPGYVPACSGHHCEPSYPSLITPSDSRIYFIAANQLEGGGSALWETLRGENTARQILPVSLRYDEEELTAVPGGRVLFRQRATPVSYPSSFWLSDGTTAGTAPFFDPPAQTTLGRYVVAGHKLYFLVLSQTRESLWVSDFTREGTFRLKENADFEIGEMVAAGDHLFFTGRSGGGQGYELGFSDGTPAGTRWLDLREGPQGSYPQNLFVLDDQRAVFGAAADEAGFELWLSDGGKAGTFRFTDLAPGEAASSPSKFAQVGNRLFFQATDGLVGFELWALDLPAARRSCPADRLCLQNGRFEVQVEALVGSLVFPGQRVLTTSESGVFSFFSPDNWEMQVKVLDGCRLNEAFWVFVSTASDVTYRLEVLDHSSGATKTYFGSGSGEPILDTSAFFTCSVPEQDSEFSPAVPAAPESRRCADDHRDLCLGEGGRYRVSATWQTESAQGRALPVADGSANSGLFTFFSPANWEMMVKVLDGCHINNKHWVFAAGTTDVAWTLTVEDRQTGATKTYQNALGEPSITLTDTAAFGCD